jgi:hypothetical protein
MNHYERNLSMRLLLVVCLMLSLFSCDEFKKETKTPEDDVVEVDGEISTQLENNMVVPDTTFDTLDFYPKEIITTGNPPHRLISIYRSQKMAESVREKFSFSSDYSSYGTDHFADIEERYMPGIDLLHGFNLVNLADYDLKSKQLNYLFDHPVIIRSVYYPSFTPDTLNKIPLHRDYYIVTVYNQDTNGDTLISTSDLRRIYLFQPGGVARVPVIPNNYSVIRSQYDSLTDSFFIFARLDANRNGQPEVEEPIHIFSMNLTNPSVADPVYPSAATN